MVAADDLAGLVTYETAARRRAGRWPSGSGRSPRPNVGLLLPATVAGDLALLGLHLAGKLPVVLNWTTGPATWPTPPGSWG